MVLVTSLNEMDFRMLLLISSNNLESFSWKAKELSKAETGFLFAAGGWQLCQLTRPETGRGRKTGKQLPNTGGKCG